MHVIEKVWKSLGQKVLDVLVAGHQSGIVMNALPCIDAAFHF